MNEKRHFIYKLWSILKVLSKISYFLCDHRSKEALKSVPKNFVADFDSDTNAYIISIMFVQSEPSSIFLLKHTLKAKILNLDVSKAAL